MKQHQQKIIWSKPYDSVSFQNVYGKMLTVLGYYKVAVSMNCRGKHMAIIWVRQI